MGEDTGLHLGCYGDETTIASVGTPHLDRLSAEGCRYRHAISTASVCAPSRASVVTGMYPWSLGTHHMRSTLLRPPRLFTHELRDAGYYVNWCTKRDFNFEPTPGWCNDANQDIANPDWTDALRDGTLPKQPFFLYANFFVTHESTMWAQPFGSDLGARHYRVELDHLLKPHQRHDPAKMAVPAYLPDTPQVRQNLAWYYDALSIQDAQVGVVFDALAASPYADNTIVIYMTDHGRGLPREKRWCYEAALHLPLIVRGPGITPGTVSDDLVNWVDIAPTILSLTQTPIPAHYQGQAFLGPAASSSPRCYAFAGRDRIDEAFDHVRVARDRRWHYIRNGWPCLPYAQRSWYMERMDAMRELRRLRAAGELSASSQLWMSDAKPTEELYDAIADPQMVRNLAGDPNHESTLMRMRAALDAHLAAVGDLGAVSEAQLIARGLVKDRLDEFRTHIQPLPPEHRLGPERTVLELHEAQAIAASTATATVSPTA